MGLFYVVVLLCIVKKGRTKSTVIAAADSTEAFIVVFEAAATFNPGTGSISTKNRGVRC